MAASSSADEISPSPRDVAERVRRVFGESFVAAYVYGSATLGGLRKHSDVDVLAVLARRTRYEERRALIHLMLEISGSRAPLGPARPVELTLVVQPDVRPWRYPPRSEFQYGEWLRDDYESGMVPDAVESADLAVLLFQVLATGRSLAGPPPDVLLDPVPAADLRRAMVDSLPELVAEQETDRNVVLTLARMWMTMETDRIEPKDVAADWALDRLPAELGRPLAHARAVYLDERPDLPRDLAAVHAFTEHAISRIRETFDDRARAA